MIDTPTGVGSVDRRGFIQLAAAGAGLAGGLSAAVAQRSESLADITAGPALVEAVVDVNEKPAKPDDLRV